VLAYNGAYPKTGAAGKNLMMDKAERTFSLAFRSGNV